MKRITYQIEGNLNCEIITDDEHLASNLALAEEEAVGEVVVTDIEEED